MLRAMPRSVQILTTTLTHRISLVTPDDTPVHYLHVEKAVPDITGQPQWHELGRLTLIGSDVAGELERAVVEALVMSVNATVKIQRELEEIKAALKSDKSDIRGAVREIARGGS